ncbi:MAG: septal ring-binding cell division protein DamX [Limisphaerales bacterium]|jgi:septal ring-binding cell division protein DamX
MKRLIRTATALVLMNTITGCSTASSVNQESANGEERKVQAREPWFCQTGEENETWDCIQSERLAAVPRPTRAPPRQDVRVVAVAVPIAAPPIEPKPVETEPIQSEPRESKPREARPAPNETAPRSENIPKHVRLAYKPEKAVSLIDLPAEFWAVQLIALSSKEALEAFATANDIRGMSAARIGAGGELFYILLLGVYESRDLATEASTDLPPPFDNPWIRSLGSLQKGMLEADRIAGNRTP